MSPPIRLYFLDCIQNSQAVCGVLLTRISMGLKFPRDKSGSQDMSGRRSLDLEISNPYINCSRSLSMEIEPAHANHAARPHLTPTNWEPLRAVVSESRSSRGREWTEPDQTRDGTKPEQCSSVDHVLHWRGFSLRVTIVDLMMGQSGADHDIHFNWATAYVSIVDHVGTQNLNRMSDHKQMHQEQCPRKNYSKKRSCCARTASVPARVDLHVESRQAASSPAAHNPHPMHSKHANNPL